MKKSKLSLNKFTVAKLNDPYKVLGGDAVDDETVFPDKVTQKPTKRN